MLLTALPAGVLRRGIDAISVALVRAIMLDHPRITDAPQEIRTRVAVRSPRARPTSPPIAAAADPMSQPWDIQNDPPIAVTNTAVNLPGPNACPREARLQRRRQPYDLRRRRTATVINLTQKKRIDAGSGVGVANCTSSTPTK
jgi:hypothetical protein